MDFAISFFELAAAKKGKDLAGAVVPANHTGIRFFFSAVFLWNGDQPAGNFFDSGNVPVSLAVTAKIGKISGDFVIKHLANYHILCYTNLVGKTEHLCEMRIFENGEEKYL